MRSAATSTSRPSRIAAPSVVRSTVNAARPPSPRCERAEPEHEGDDEADDHRRRADGLEADRDGGEDLLHVHQALRLRVKDAAPAGVGA